MTGGAEREGQAEQQRRPLLLHLGTPGEQAERRLQPLRGGRWCLRLDCACRLGEQVDRPEVTELGSTLDVIGLCRQRCAADEPSPPAER